MTSNKQDLWGKNTDIDAIEKLEIPIHAPEKESWEDRYFGKFDRLITHPLANGLKDFISSELTQAREEVVGDIFKIVDYPYDQRKIEAYAKSRGMKLDDK